MRFAFIFALALLAMPHGLAAESRYSTWGNPDSINTGASADAQLRSFRDHLNKLVDEAEKAKAADPLFLKDLRNLANGTPQTVQRSFLEDTFADGDYSANPTWQVLSGAYFIESGWGLRNRIITAGPQTQSTTSGEDFAKVLLGQILQRAAGTQGQTATENVIVSRAAISNAFSIEVEMSSWITDNHFEIGVFQGEDAKKGYRLLYVSGKGLQLLRVGASGTGVVATSDKAVTLEDKKYHIVAWKRGTDGAMRVSIDGSELIATNDRGFSDPFDGVRFSDRGGDVIVKRVSVKGL